MSLNLCVILLLSLTIIGSANIITNEENENGIERPNLTGCECDHYTCGCCQHIKVASVHLDDTVCTNITYLPNDIGFSLTITFDSFAILNTTISARNPPPICIGQDYIKELEAEICIRFYNLDANKHHLHGCLKFEVEFYKFKLASYDLGCFDLGPKNSTNNQNVIKTTGFRRFWPWSKNQNPQVVMI